MNCLSGCTLFGFLIGILTCSVSGQFYPQIRLYPELARLFDNDFDFTGNVEAVSLHSNVKTDTWPLRVAVAGNFTRVEMDITQMKSEHPAQNGKDWQEYVGNMSKAGSAESVWIFNPRMKLMFTLLPKLKIYAEEPIPDDMLAQLKTRTKTTRTEMGAEEIDGQPCTKIKIRLDKDPTDSGRISEATEAFVWKSKTSPHAALRVVTLDSTGNTNAIFTFKDVKIKKPEPALFQPPAAFIKGDQESMTKRIMENWPKSK